MIVFDANTDDCMAVARGRKWQPLIERVINGTIPENLCISRVRNTISNIWDDQLQEFRVEA